MPPISDLKGLYQDGLVYDEGGTGGRGVGSVSPWDPLGSADGAPPPPGLEKLATSNDLNAYIQTLTLSKDASKRT